MGWVSAIWNPARQCGDAPLGGEADDDAGDASRRENARAELPNRLEDHQHRRERDNPDDRHGRLLEHDDLCVDRARLQVVADVEPMLAEDERRRCIHDLEQDECDDPDEQQTGGISDDLGQRRGHRQRRRAQDERQKRKRAPNGFARQRQKEVVPRGVRPGG
jgi:hypothetical protein